MLERLGIRTGHPEADRPKDLQTRLLNAYDSFQAEGIEEVTPYQLNERAEHLYPPKHWWQRTGHGKLYRAMAALEDDKKLKRRQMSAAEAAEHGNIRGYFYRRLQLPTPTEQ